MENELNEYRIFCGKQFTNETIINQICQLFLNNYENYHYDKFHTKNGILELLSDKQFDCTILVNNQDIVCGFAGFYANKPANSNLTEILLAHLLVSNDNRGKGLGSILEDHRLKMIQKTPGQKVIYASCVEKPFASIFMKLKRGFKITGIRYHYRPGTFERENSIVLTYKYCQQNEIVIESPTTMTQRIINLGNPSIKMKQQTKKKNKHLIYYNYDTKLKRLIGHITEDSVTDERECCELTENFLDQIKNCESYIGLRVSPTIGGFKHLDKLLLSHLYYPVSYIPCINGGSGILEYQYLPLGVNSLLTDTTISTIGRGFLKNICKTNN